MYGLSGFTEKLNIQKCVNSTRNCVHYMYGFYGFAENLNSVDAFNVQNCINSIGNCVIRCKDCMDLQKICASLICLNLMRNSVH